METEKIYDELVKVINSNQIFKNEPMSKHTSFKIGGNADIYVKVKTIEDIKVVLKVAKENNTPTTIIGNGSNVLVKDNGIRGIVIRNRFTRYRNKRRNGTSRCRRKASSARFYYTKK